jgi:hypothetical protein
MQPDKRPSRPRRPQPFRAACESPACEKLARGANRRRYDPHDPAATASRGTCDPAAGWHQLGKGWLLVLLPR